MDDKLIKKIIGIQKFFISKKKKKKNFRNILKSIIFGADENSKVIVKIAPS